MFTTGSKLLIGSAVLAGVAALVYGLTQGGSLGTIGLISAMSGLGLLAGINAWTRDCNVSAMDHDAFPTAAASQDAARPSLWPLIAAVGITAMALGMVTYKAIFMLGLVALAAAAIEWLSQNWSERASVDQHVNASSRNALIDPLELPVAGAAGAGIIVYSFSRVMLGVPSKSATVVTFSVVAAIVLAIATAISMRRHVSRSALTGTLAVVVLALITGGAIYGLNGERHIEAHHTTADIAEEDECESEETEADENASQNVSLKSNVSAEITFDGSSLEPDVPGFDGDDSTLTLPRSNPNNVMFHNESTRPARLVIDMHPRLDENQLPVGPERLCTSLVEPGGVQLLTIVFARPSFALAEPYAFHVPGADAELEVSVP